MLVSKVSTVQSIEKCQKSNKCPNNQIAKIASNASKTVGEIFTRVVFCLARPYRTKPVFKNTYILTLQVISTFLISKKQGGVLCNKHFLLALEKRKYIQ